VSEISLNPLRPFLCCGPSTGETKTKQDSSKCASPEFRELDATVGGGDAYFPDFDTKYWGALNYSDYCAGSANYDDCGSCSLSWT